MKDPYILVYSVTIAVTFALTVLLEHVLLPWLTRMGGQPIYAEGPEWHKSKSGTPTMGGIAFLISSAAAVLPSALLMLTEKETEHAISLLLCYTYAALNSLIGIIDDLKKLKKRQNAGLSPRQKLALQFICVALLLIARKFLLPNVECTLFGIDIGVLYYPMTAVLAVGLVNFANLTDGVDGLAAGVAFSIGISMLLCSYSLSAPTAILSSVTIGVTAAFLIFNSHPAKVFMGDTGSLFLGALTVSSVLVNADAGFSLPIFSVYVAEGVSVILQVVIFKLWRRRIFKMAPLHHHLEKCGWSENRICIAAMMITMLLSLPVYAFYML